jgi:hypothetical protein
MKIAYDTRHLHASVPNQIRNLSVDLCLVKETLNYHQLSEPNE